MRTNKKKRGCDPRRSRDTSSFGRLRSQTVLSSLNMVRGMATCRGRWILPPGARVEPRIGFMGRGDPAYAVCFLSQISPDVWLLSGSEVTCPFRKNAEEQNNQGATFFPPLLLLLFVNAKRRARASHPPLVHEVGFRSCEALPGSN